tara:strand:- start:924 stop:1946 length:1023 start_codon:yes stop_codon:yes gene_type:complete
MIVIIVFIILITINLVSSEDESEFKIFKKQNFFDLQLILIFFSIIYIIIQLILYTVLFVKVYNRYLDTFLRILVLDMDIERIITSININFSALSSEAGNTDPAVAAATAAALSKKSKVQKIFKNINDGISKEKIINDILILFENDGTVLTAAEANANPYLKNMINILKLYILINHVDEEIQDDNNKIVNIYIKKKPFQNLDDENVFKLDTMYYSYLKNNNRNKEIPYFLIDHDKLKNYTYKALDGAIQTIGDTKIRTINKNLESIQLRKEINQFIDDINKKIANINIIFNDENYILDLGIYLLLFVIMGSIYIIIVIIAIIKTWTNIASNNKFTELFEIN